MPSFSIIHQMRWRMLEKMRHLKVLFEFTVTMTLSISMRIFMRTLPWIRFRHFPRCQNISRYLSDHTTQLRMAAKPSDGHKFLMTILETLQPCSAEISPIFYCHNSTRQEQLKRIPCIVVTLKIKASFLG
jgi:hypothetical protein